MLRVLFLILSVVSVTLAIVLDQPLLYVVAGAMLLAALITLVLYFRQRHKRSQASYIQPINEEEDSLGNYGILEIRPRSEPASAQVASKEGEEAFVETSEDKASLKPKPVAGGKDPEEEARRAAQRRRASRAAARTPGVHMVTKPRPVHLAVKAAAESQNASVLLPCLESLRAALKAYTVCVLSQNEQDHRYSVEGVVSRNAYARSLGRFSTTVPLLPEGTTKPVLLQRVGHGGLPPKALRYYLEPIAVRQLAVAPIPVSSEGTAYLLIADTMEDGGLEGASYQALMVQYAALVASLLEGDKVSPTLRDVVPPPDPVPEPELEIEPEPEVVPEPELDEVEAAVQPRREIIAEEMAKARKDDCPLALALVYLNGAEDFDAADEVALLEAEQALESVLRTVVEEGRVERFGELTYGVFYRNHADVVASWATGFQDDLAAEKGVLEGGVSIGVALLGMRHQSPDDFRADAMLALREAYETDTCTILE